MALDSAAPSASVTALVQLPAAAALDQRLAAIRRQSETASRHPQYRALVERTQQPRPGSLARPRLAQPAVARGLSPTEPQPIRETPRATARRPRWSLRPQAARVPRATRGTFRVVHARRGQSDPRSPCHPLRRPRSGASPPSTRRDGFHLPAASAAAQCGLSERRVLREARLATRVRHSDLPAAPARSRSGHVDLRSRRGPNKLGQHRFPGR